MFWLLLSLVCFVYFEYTFLWGEKAILFYQTDPIYFISVCRLHLNKKLNIFLLTEVTEIQKLRNY